MKMKRKINKWLLLASFIIVLIVCGVCVFGSVRGSVYVKTNGTPSKNITNLFEAIVSADGDACVQYTDSFKKIGFSSSKEGDAVSTICSALNQSYAYTQEPAAKGEDRLFESVNTVQFSYLDLSKLTEDITAKFEDYIFAAIKEFDTSVTDSDGNYIPEVYDKAFELAAADLLQTPENYSSSETVEMKSVYDVQKGQWRTDISSQLANMLRGGITGSSAAETISVPKAVKRYVKDSVATLRGESVTARNEYTLSYTDTVAPKPNNDNYVSIPVENADQVLNIISYARSCGLLGEQEVIFDPKANFYPEDIVCYCDETILVICWKEYIQNCVCNCMEVKLAHGSQIKRKLTGDVFNSGKLETVSNMSAATNAVAATSADYYAYRDIGLSVYQSKIQRYQLSCEVLMIDNKGRFLFYYPDEKSEAELQKFINDNKVQFSLAFGPVLIDNYTPRYYTDGYAFGLGEMKECYSRSAFGEFDDLHYLFMTSGYSESTKPPENLDAFVKILFTKNLKNAYNLDGGQTAEIAIMNRPYNQIDYGGERQVSDMMYFATAIPEN